VDLWVGETFDRCKGKGEIEEGNLMQNHAPAPGAGNYNKIRKLAKKFRETFEGNLIGRKKARG